MQTDLAVAQIPFSVYLAFSGNSSCEIDHNYTQLKLTLVLYNIDISCVTFRIIDPNINRIILTLTLGLPWSPKSTLCYQCVVHPDNKLENQIDLCT